MSHTTEKSDKWRGLKIVLLVLGVVLFVVGWGLALVFFLQFAPTQANYEREKEQADACQPTIDLLTAQVGSAKSSLASCKEEVSNISRYVARNNDWGVTMYYPSDWYEDKINLKSVDNTISYILRLSKNATVQQDMFGSSITIWNYDYKREFSTDEAYQGNIDYIRNNPNCTLFKHDKFTLNNLPAFGVVYTCKRPDSYNTKRLLFGVKNGEYEWFLTYESDASHYDEDLSRALAIMETITFDNVVESQSVVQQQTQASSSSSSGSSAQDLYWGISILKLLFG